jgi:broad specificity phosphatase PhoE
MDGLFEGKPSIHEDPRLIEKHFGSTSFEEGQDEKFNNPVMNVLHSAFNRLHEVDPYTTRPPFGESQKDLHLAAKGFTEGTLYRQIAEGKNDFLVVTHGAFIKAFIMAWAHVKMQDKKCLHIGNGDVISLTGEPQNWKFLRLYDGVQGIPVHQNILEGLHRFSIDDLPPVPGFLKQTPNS